MAGKSVAKYLVMATGKIDGKVNVWPVATFAGVAQAKPWVALLKLARKSSDVETVRIMDIHQPGIGTDAKVADVIYRGLSLQYNPEAAGLSDDTELG